VKKIRRRGGKVRYVTRRGRGARPSWGERYKLCAYAAGEGSRWLVFRKGERGRGRKETGGGQGGRKEAGDSIKGESFFGGQKAKGLGRVVEL